MLTLTADDCAARAQRDERRAVAAEDRGDHTLAAKLWRAARAWREAAASAQSRAIGHAKHAMEVLPC